MLRNKLQDIVNKRGYLVFVADVFAKTDENVSGFLIIPIVMNGVSRIDTVWFAWQTFS